MDTELDRPSQGWRTRKCVATRFIFTRLGNNLCRAPRCLCHPIDFLADAPAADQHRVVRLPLDLGNVRHEHLERACLSDQSAVSLSWRRPSSRSRSERRVFFSPCVSSRTMGLTVAALPASPRFLAVARLCPTGSPASLRRRAPEGPGALGAPPTFPR